MAKRPSKAKKTIINAKPNTRALAKSQTPAKITAKIDKEKVSSSKRQPSKRRVDAALSSQRKRYLAKTLVWALIVLVLGFTYALISTGFIPGISTLAGSSHPRDLGVNYTGTDKANARMKSQLQYGTLPVTTPVDRSIQRRGSREISTEFSSAELSALLNGRPYKYWPLENVQLRINHDNTVEISGRLLSEKLENYALAEGVPAVLASNLRKFIAYDPAFYIKGKLAINGNNISSLEVSRLEIGKLRIPIFLAKKWSSGGLAKVQYDEQDTGDPTIDLIDNILDGIDGIDIREAGFKNGMFFYEGSLSAEELTVR